MCSNTYSWIDSSPFKDLWSLPMEACKVTVDEIEVMRGNHINITGPLFEKYGDIVRFGKSSYFLVLRTQI